MTRVAPVMVTIVTGPDRHARAEAASLVARRFGECRTAGDSDVDIDALVARLDDAASSAPGEALALGIDDALEPADVGLALHSAIAVRDWGLTPLHVRDVVAVVEAAELRRILDPDRDEGDGTSLQRIATRMEYATAIIITGDAPARSADLANALNPRAPILLVDRARSLGAERFRRLIRPPVDDLATEQGWMLALDGRALRHPEGVNSVVFRDPRPFHAGRLATVIARCLTPEHAGAIWRSRGIMRLATRPGQVGSWSSVGAHLNLDPTGLSDDEPDVIGGQEIAFVGERLHAERIVRALGAAVLANDELIAGPMEWANYDDPFPAWNLGHTH